MLFLPQVSDPHAPGQHDLKENVIHQTKPLFSIAPWCGSEAHIPIGGAYTGGQGSAWEP